MRSVIGSTAILLFVFCLALRATRAQQTSSPLPPNPPAPTQADIEQVLTQFMARADEYEAAFKNLMAEETKIIEAFQSSGELAKQRRIISDLIVYQSPRDSQETAEYRNARVVDGKPVEKRDERALKLLIGAAQADSIEKELRRINQESRQYEFNFHYSGFTINQGWPLRKWRDFYRFELIGQEPIAGQDAVVLRYQQTKLIPEAKSKFSLPSEFTERQVLQRGRLWLDLRTSQLWREEKEWTVRHPSVAEPLVLIRQEMTYAPSSFGILVPQHFVFNSFLHFRHRKKEPPVFLLGGRTTYTYGVFKRFDVTGEESDKKTAPVIKSPDSSHQY